MRALCVSEGKHERSGALGALVSRLRPTEMPCDQDDVKRNDIHAHHGQGQGYFKRAIRWLLEARSRGYDALILLIDQDGCPERVTQIEDAQNRQLGVARRALGVAIQTFDAWMLADETALTQTLGTNVERQPQPEKTLTPKQRCAELLETAPNSMPQSEMYARVAKAASLDILCERCPQGFAPFAERVRAL